MDYSEKAGIIYVVGYPEWQGMVKIGRTNNLERRMLELDNTSAPTPLECYYAVEVGDVNFVEKQVHNAFNDYRDRASREWFRDLSLESIKAVLQLVIIKDVTPQKDYVETEEDEHSLDKAKERRDAFNFSMVKVPTGSILTFSQNPTITCTVIDNKSVDFEGEKTSLSSSALKIFHRQGYKWKTVAGTDYWQYKGESMTLIRRRLEGFGL